MGQLPGLVLKAAALQRRRREIRLGPSQCERDGNQEFNRKMTRPSNFAVRETWRVYPYCVSQSARTICTANSVRHRLPVLANTVVRMFFTVSILFVNSRVLASFLRGGYLRISGSRLRLPRKSTESPLFKTRYFVLATQGH